MSTTFIKTSDVPQYIREIVRRMYPTCIEAEVPGMTFKLYGKHKVGYEGQLINDCADLLKWAERYYADAHIVTRHFWFDDVPYGGAQFSGAHRDKAYRLGFKNYYTIVVTDPVARIFEMNNFFR